jgi:hypothetical protein
MESSTSIDQVSRKEAARTEALFESSVDGSLFAFQGVMTRKHYTIRYHDVACYAMLLLICLACSQLFSVLLSRECIAISRVSRSEWINGRPMPPPNKEAFRHPFPKSDLCQKQRVPRKQLLVLGDCLHREGLPSLETAQEGKSPVKTVYCTEALSYYELP